MKRLWWRLTAHLRREDEVDVDAIMADFETSFAGAPKRRRGRPARLSDASCPTPGKRAYRSLSEARAARSSRMNKGDRMKTYHCPCGAFHLARREA